MTDPSAGADAPAASDAWTDDFRAAVVDLLGALAYGELSAFSQLAADAESAPSVRDKAEVARLAVTEFLHYEQIVARLEALGADPRRPSRRSRGPSTRSTSGPRRTTGSRASSRPTSETGSRRTSTGRFGLRRRRHAGTGRVGHRGHGPRRVRRACRPAGDRRGPRIGGRLALWGRRLVGEALTQAQRVGVERDALASLLVGAPGRRVPISPSSAACSRA